MGEEFKKQLKSRLKWHTLQPDEKLDIILEILLRTVESRVHKTPSKKEIVEWWTSQGRPKK